MTAQASAMTAESTSRFAGWAAITSGAIGIVAYGFLWAALVSRIRGAAENAYVLLFRTHDLGVILQSLFMIPVVFTLGAIGSQHSRGVSRATVAVGVAALSLIVLCLLLIFVNVIADTIYLVPQGVLGAWLIVVNRLLSSVLPRTLTWLGIVCGVGLVLVAAFPSATACLLIRLCFMVRSRTIRRIPRGRRRRTGSSITSFSPARSWASQRIRSGPRWSAADCSGKKARDRPFGFNPY